MRRGADAVSIAYPGSVIEIRRHAATVIGDRVRASWPAARRVFVITDANVAALHLAGIQRALEAAEFTLHARAIPAGEDSKSLEVAGALYAWLADHHAERGEPVIALGGGVVGDLGGFVAATYLRGVPLVQLPTTLLAMVDSSVGGKTGVNLPTGKNLVGAFYPPTMVMVDPVFLATVSSRELRSGWAEVIKYAFLEGSIPGAGAPILHQLLREERRRLRDLEPDPTSRAIERCIELKARVVALDEREGGLRRILNLGHTLGHAIEAVAGYGTYAHGEAVGLGLLAVTTIANRLGHCGDGVFRSVDELLAAFALPRELTELPVNAIIARTKGDKKAQAGRVTWVLPSGPDTVMQSSDVPDELVGEVLLELGARAG